MGIRDLVKAISPPWLIGTGTVGAPLPAVAGIAERFLYSIAIGSDLLVYKIEQAIWLRFPGYSNGSSLAQLGQDRVIPRGRDESDDSYAERLRAWLDTWRRAGTPWGVLGSVYAYLPVRARTQSILMGVGQSVWDIIPAGQTPKAAPVVHHVAPPNWIWDALPWPQRRWLVVDHSDGVTAWVSVLGDYGAGTLWGDATVSWGLATPSTLGDDLRALVRQWKSAATRYPWIVVLFDPAWADWTDAPGGPTVPDSAYEAWSKIDTSGPRAVRVPSRFADGRYLDGVRS